MERVFAHYLVETPLTISRAAEVLASEQSSGTFVAVPGETKELRERFGARVEEATELETANGPSLPGCLGEGGKFHRAKIVISWPVENMGFNLPALVSTVAGNLYELAEFSGLKLMDLELPPSFTKHFRGPKFGIAGTRRLTGVEGRPLIGTIIKPSIGLSPQQTASLVQTLAESGIDFVKDDELMANPPHSPFEERVEAVMRVINSHSERTGKKVMFAFNVSDEMDAMLGHYEKVVEAGGTAVMVSLNSVGLSGVKRLCDLGALAVHGHRNGWGALTRHPLLGMEFAAYQKIWRLAGADQIHVNGLANKFWEPDDSVVKSIEACLAPLLGGFQITPVLSSGQWGGQAFETYRRVKTIDILYLAGGGIMAHPDGPAAGVKAIRQAWEGAVAGMSLEEAGRKYPEFGKSVEKFGKRART
ncbi:MAG TPA: ribulose-bisphosphate carboxylase large subunit family protein [Candidatus Eisenbacteria bacterium]|nr:ribulose-bisphosphate carboxylase large subunit family protein [Candidatus Eisenbacteria bacterium]